LPFANTSGDPGQEYVADAITDDITVELSRIRGSFVIGRGTAFSYKGKALDLREIAKELNVRYILQGTASRTDGIFRVTTQLADGTSGANIWADNTEKEGEKVAEIRHDVVAHLAILLNLQLVSAEAKRAETKSNPDSVDLTMQAWGKFNQNRTNDNAYLAIKLLDKALKIQPDYEPALAGRARIKHWIATDQPDIMQPFLEAEKDALRAIQLDPSDPVPYLALSGIEGYLRRPEESRLANDRALELNPNYVEALRHKSDHLLSDGSFQLSLENIENAIYLSPRDPDMDILLFTQCKGYFYLGNFTEAKPLCSKYINSNPSWEKFAYLLAIYAALGDVKKSELMKTSLTKIVPAISIGWIKGTPPIANHALNAQQADEQYLFLNLRKAGIPD
jgi:TolB-like protein